MGPLIPLPGPWPDLLLALTVIAPLAGLGLLAVPRAPGWVVALLPLFALPALSTALAVPSETTVEWPWLLTGLRLILDSTGRVFLLTAAVLWLTAGGFAGAYLGPNNGASRFAGFYLAAMTGNFGLTLTTDPAPFLVFFALMGLSSFGLILHTGTAPARRAGNVYLGATITGELLAFSGLAAGVTAHQGIPSAWAVGALIVGLGLKAGLVPLHFWLPLAHPAAPAPASAVLSGSMIKAGLLGWMRFLPLGQEAAPDWGLLLVALGLAGAFLGALVGLAQRDPKTILAYSSISQMGWMAALVGIGLRAPEAWPLLSLVLLAYVLHHCLAKGALFLGAGAVAHGVPTGIPRLLAMVGLGLPALALAGAAGTSGAAVKWGFKKAGTGLDPVSGLAVALLPAGAVATSLLLARFLYRSWPPLPAAPSLAAGPWIWWLLLALLGFPAAWLWEPTAIWGRQSLAAGQLLPSLYPILLAAAATLAAIGLSRLRKGPVPSWVPPGDIYAAAERGALAFLGHWKRSGPGWVRLWEPENRLGELIHRKLWVPARTRLTTADQWRWATSGAAFLGLLAALFLLLLLDR